MQTRNAKKSFFFARTVIRQNIHVPIRYCRQPQNPFFSWFRIAYAALFCYYIGLNIKVLFHQSARETKDGFFE
jgi:hypothetical protein